jgi:hypothetical protein
MANLSKAVCHGESDKCRFGNPPQESNFQRLGIIRSFGWDKYIRFFEGAQRGPTNVLTKAELVSDAAATVGRPCVMVGDTESEEQLLKSGAYVVVANVRELSEHLAGRIGQIAST